MRWTFMMSSDRECDGPKIASSPRSPGATDRRFQATVGFTKAAADLAGVLTPQGSNAQLYRCGTNLVAVADGEHKTAAVMVGSSVLSTT